MSSAERYRYVGIEAYPLGNESGIAYSSIRRNAEILPLADLELLGSCTTFRTLEEHADACPENVRPGGDVASASRRLKELAAAGFLVSRKEFLNTTRPAPSAPGHISALGILTCNRPDRFKRCLESYARNARDHGRSVELLVMDDSKKPDVLKENRDTLRAVRKEFGLPVRYADRERKRRYVDLLAEAGIPKDVAEFALGDPEGIGHTTGANRNALLLDTVGEMFVSVDDDTVCRTAWPPQKSPAALAVASSLKGSETWSFPDHESAIQAMKFSEMDLVGAHEAYLGKQVTTLIEEASRTGEVDFDRMEDSLFQIVRSGDARVRLNMCGIVGDSAEGSTLRYLLLRGSSRDRMFATESSYRSSIHSLEAAHSIICPTVTNIPVLMTYGVAYDQRSLLPPFSPVLRSQDTVFAWMIRQCFPSACIAHLPWMLLHERPPDPVSAPTRSASVTPKQHWRWRTGFNADLICFIIGSFHMGPFKPGGSARLRTLGAHFQDVAALPVPEFREILRRIAWQNAGEDLETMEERLNESGGEPEYWARDLRSSMKGVRERLLDPRFMIPSDVRGGIDRSRRLVSRFGALLQNWDSIVEAARDLRSREVRPSEPVETLDS